MSERVVHRLEMIEIGQNDPEREAVPDRVAQLELRPVFDGAPVWQSGETIGKRKFLEHYVFSGNALAQLGQPEPGADPGQQLAAMEWLCEIVVRSGTQCFHQAT